MKHFRRGSAYLIALGVLGVLVIVFLTFSSSSRSRRWSTRFTSSESKAEALAEAAVELGLRLVRNEMNQHATPSSEWYGIFRAPAPMVNGGATLGTGGGDDLPLNLTITPACYAAQTWTVADKLAPLQNLITDIPGSITVVLDTVIAGASAIAAKNANYHVVGVNKKSIAANYNAAEVLDDSQGSPSTTYGLPSALISDYQLNFRLPGNANQYNETVSISIPGYSDLFGDLDVPVTIKKMTPAPCDDFEVIASILAFEFKMEFHIYPEYLRKYLEGESATTQDLKVQDFAKNFAMKPPNWTAFQWGCTSKVTSSFSGAYSALPAPTQNALAGSTGFQAAMVVEKTGNLRLTATVHYQPQIGGKTITRILSAERDFKVSDCQPVAPEYVFFISNSDKTYENLALKLYSNPEYAENYPIKFADYSVGPMAIATSTIHSLAKDPTNPNATPTYNILIDSFGTGGGIDGMHLPGMIRVNGTGLMKTNVFMGCLGEVFTTEYNVMAVQKSGTPSVEDRIDPRFEKLSGPFRTFQLPFLTFNEYALSSPGIFTGFKAVFDVYKGSSTLSPVTPMLFFGNFAGEYPFSLNVEGNLQQRYSEVAIKFKPAYDGWELSQGIDIQIIPPEFKGFDPAKVDWEKADKTEVHIAHQWKDRDFGMPDFPPQGGPWDPTKPECLPANLYSSMQYAKKATYYYETAADFQADIANRSQGGVFDCSGVSFIKTGLVEIPFDKVKGHGLIVSNQHIKVKTNIKREGAPGETSLGLIARLGRITFQGAINNVEAACYSNFTPINNTGGSLKIDGNMIVNHFMRNEFNNFHVYYNGPGCRVSLLSLARDVGKYEPKRYHVALGNQWARFEYEKQ